MLVVVQKVEQEFTKSGAEYRKVTGTTGDGKQTTKNVFDNLQDKWELLVEGTPLEFTMEKKGQFWNVKDIKPVEMPEPKEPIEPASAKGEATPEEIKRLAETRVKSDPRQVSIERQSALKDAVEIECALIQAGKVFVNDKYPADRIAKIKIRAEEFYKYLEAKEE